MSSTSLKLKDLTLIRQNKILLNSTSLCLDPGEAAVLCGSNGCGKTTLLRCITGLYPIKSGSVLINGMDIESWRWKKNRKILAYVPQEQSTNSFPVSVSEMVETGLAGVSTGKKKRQEIIRRSLEDTGCLNLINRSYFSLSGGERQRVSLARCLSQEARLLILDEPLTYLDKEGRSRFSTVLENIRQRYGISILLVTHSEDDFTGFDWKKIHFNNQKLEVLEC